jgi:hypothetical protein
MAADEATFFYTLATGAYFSGTVALLNSLTVSGNPGRLVVADAGLTGEQRARLEPHAEVVAMPADVAARPFLAKPYAARTQDRGVAVFIDSDMLVTRSLEPYVDLARDGVICVFADHVEARGRSFDTWRDLLGLRSPVRPQTYVNAGFVSLSVDHFPWFLERWLELCLRAPPDQAMTTPAAPFYAADQDVLNALLASEVPARGIRLLPEEEAVYWDELREVELVDADALECRFRGRRPAILHYSFAPKPWAPRGWLRVKDDAFVRLLPRVLSGDDVALRLDPGELPFWLRGDRRARLFLRSADTAHAGLKHVVSLLPERLRRPLLRLRERVYEGLRR